MGLTMWILYVVKIINACTLDTSDWRQERKIGMLSRESFATNIRERLVLTLIKTNTKKGIVTS